MRFNLGLVQLVDKWRYTPAASGELLRTSRYLTTLRPPPLPSLMRTESQSWLPSYFGLASEACSLAIPW